MTIGFGSRHRSSQASGAQDKTTVSLCCFMKLISPRKLTFQVSLLLSQIPVTRGCDFNRHTKPGERVYVNQWRSDFQSGQSQDYFTFLIYFFFKDSFLLVILLLHICECRVVVVWLEHKSVGTCRGWREPLEQGAGNLTQVLWKSSICSKLLSHCFSRWSEIS